MAKAKTGPDIDAITGALLGESKETRGIPRHTTPMPSPSALEEMMLLLRDVLYPGFFGSCGQNEGSRRRCLAARLDDIFRILAEQIGLGICFICTDRREDCTYADEAAFGMAGDFMRHLPDIRDLLDSDVQAAYEGDPAAQSKAETIFCYPSLRAMTNHRIAHELYKLEVPVIPRIIGEMAHAHTGIDIHPGARIGEEFFIDHGTGVVIGETCVIGKRCRLYQGVTLGALSFPKNADGSLTKGLPRHPILEDNVTVYSGATILGRVTIGAGSIIGGNVWLTNDVPPGSKVIQQHSTTPTAADKLLGSQLSRP